MADTVPVWIQEAEDKADEDLEAWSAGDDDDVSDEPSPDWADDSASPSTDDDE